MNIARFQVEWVCWLGTEVTQPWWWARILRILSIAAPEDVWQQLIVSLTDRPAFIHLVIITHTHSQSCDCTHCLTRRTLPLNVMPLTATTLPLSVSLPPQSRKCSIAHVRKWTPHWPDHLPRLSRVTHVPVNLPQSPFTLPSAHVRTRSKAGLCWPHPCAHTHFEPAIYNFRFKFEF